MTYDAYTYKPLYDRGGYTLSIGETEGADYPAFAINISNGNGHEVDVTVDMDEAYAHDEWQFPGEDWHAKQAELGYEVAAPGSLPISGNFDIILTFSELIEIVRKINVASEKAIPDESGRKNIRVEMAEAIGPYARIYGERIAWLRRPQPSEA